MSGFEWFLLVVVVILVPLVVAVAITLWTLEMARQRNRKNREAASPGATPVKRKATRDAGDAALAASTGGSNESTRGDQRSVSTGTDARGEATVSPTSDDPDRPITPAVASPSAARGGTEDAGSSSSSDSADGGGSDSSSD